MNDPTDPRGIWTLLTGPWRSAIGPIHPDDPTWDTTLRWREHDA